MIRIRSVKSSIDILTRQGHTVFYYKYFTFGRQTFLFFFHSSPAGPPSELASMFLWVIGIFLGRAMESAFNPWGITPPRPHMRSKCLEYNFSGVKSSQLCDQTIMRGEEGRSNTDFLKKIQIKIFFFFRHSVSSTYPWQSASWSDRPWYFWISILSASLVALREKLKKADPNFLISWNWRKRKKNLKSTNSARK